MQCPQPHSSQLKKRSGHCLTTGIWGSSTQNDLHKLRVDTKELRYILDILGSYIKHGKQESKDLKKLQEILGKINDTYVAEKVIQKFPAGGYDFSKQYIADQATHLRHKYLIQLKKYYIETIH